MNLKNYPAKRRDFCCIDLKPGIMDMYFVAIVLPDELNKEILQWKQYMFDNYNCKVGLKSPAHITLIPPFWMDPQNEQAFISDVDAIAGQLQPFQIHTNNFSSFKPRTIFVDVLKNEQLDALKKTTDTFFQQHNPYGLKIDTRPFHPHITIATRDLFKKDYHAVWPKFAYEEYKRVWEANALSILKHNKKTWDILHTSTLST